MRENDPGRSTIWPALAWGVVGVLAGSALTIVLTRAMPVEAAWIASASGVAVAGWLIGRRWMRSSQRPE